jgi:hypothetical protein
MSCHASIRRHVPSPPITAEDPCGISRAQEWRPGSIVTLAASEAEIETQLVIDRLLRECFTLKSMR